MLSHMVIASAYTADSLQMNVQDMHSGLAIVDLQSVHEIRDQCTSVSQLSRFDAIVISMQICGVNCGAFLAMTDYIAALLH